MLFTVLIVQMCKVPTNDYFLLKGGIYLCIGTLVRIGSCVYMFSVYMRFEAGNAKVTHPNAYGLVLSQMIFEVPIYMMLLTFYSLLFSTYKLYLVIQEMLGFTQSAAEMQA